MKPDEFPKSYAPGEVEDGLYEVWMKSGFFNPDNLPDRREEAFSIVLPPPNVTGTLHVGHAAMLAIEDAMVRFARMRGTRALWVPGTDHAAIATQTKVEKNLMKEEMKDPRRELGREEFLKHVAEFAADSHDIIVNQMKKMGCSLDWSREAYTLDEKRSRAVRAAFTRMYNDGLIYQGQRVVNWCPRCQSTLADDEVEYREHSAKLYTFRYGKDFPIAISTTRPETKLGDTAVAVHPDDPRYKKFVGKEFPVVFAGQQLTIQVVADASVDKEFGTGALGVTPAHSLTDADMARTHHLPLVQVIGEDGRILPSVESGFAGLSVKEAREKVVAWLQSEGLMEKEEDAVQNLSVCYRCESAIEPLPKTQWFINVNKPFRWGDRKGCGIKADEDVTLKDVMRHVVKTGEVKILPPRFEKIYFHWIDNLRDWNISRQIWFGHRVPVWYRAEETFVGNHAPEGKGWEQDPDTLDTWFSAGLWTLSPLGWPDDTEDLRRFHPTSVLETGYDIIFFWVARMILMTTYLVGEVPFRTVYLHGLVRDEKGRKMSKSLDNVIDPLDTIKAYGADATRLSLLVGTTPGNDLKLSEEKIASYRNFANKLWNIARFILTNEGYASRQSLPKTKTRADEWVLGRLSEVIASATGKMERYELSSAAEELRDFTWNEFADWYVEIAKIEKGKEQILSFVLEQLLILWHPFMPFVTEEIWRRMGKETLLLVEPWPKSFAGKVPEGYVHVHDVIRAIRHLRTTYKIEPAKRVSVVLVSKKEGSRLRTEHAVIEGLARVEYLSVVPGAEKPPQSASMVVGDTVVYLSLEGLVDGDAERERFAKEEQEAKDYLKILEKKLQNKEFLSKAPEAVISDLKTKYETTRTRLQKIQTELETLA
ncbi:valine--tRNA ligase [Candidatus Uhrbacteria bacterium]|nr:valine--tRNA ligase [Candidatus Uhrbacteria bacterium]